ncbi:hypothetical protein KDV52_06120 [Providencia rettgeri]
MYNTGTVTTTANSTKLVGTNTKWLNNINRVSAEQAIQIQIDNTVYNNSIHSIQSDTELTLNFPLPIAATGAKYVILTTMVHSVSDAMNKIVSMNVSNVQFSDILTRWMTEQGIITVTLPDQTTQQLRTTKEMDKQLDGKFDKAGGEVSGELKVKANIQAINAVLQAIHTESGVSMQLDATFPEPNVRSKRKTSSWRRHILPDADGTLMQIGDYGVGAHQSPRPDGANLDNALLTGAWDPGGSTNTGGAPFGFAYAPVFTVSRNQSEKFQLAAWEKEFFFRYYRNGKFNDWGKVYTTFNATKDSNGNLKAASPIIKVFADHTELNDESEGVELEKLGTGRYKLKGTLGMHSDASWGGIHGGLVVPNGINNLPLVWADFDVLPDGDIVIETRYRKHALHPMLEAQRLMTYLEFLDENNEEREDYDYCDIPRGHWIDVRVNMPSNSIYNQKQAEAERLAKLEAGRLAQEEAKRAAEEAERAEQEAAESQSLDDKF